MFLTCGDGFGVFLDFIHENLPVGPVLCGLVWFLFPNLRDDTFKASKPQSRASGWSRLSGLQIVQAEHGTDSIHYIPQQMPQTYEQHALNAVELNLLQPKPRKLRAEVDGWKEMNRILALSLVCCRTKSVNRHYGMCSCLSFHILYKHQVGITVWSIKYILNLTFEKKNWTAPEYDRI